MDPLTVPLAPLRFTFVGLMEMSQNLLDDLLRNVVHCNNELISRLKENESSLVAGRPSQPTPSADFVAL